MGVFTAALKGFEDRTGEKADRFVRYVMLEFRTRLIVRSPVDTGRFRNNWQYGVEVAPSGVIEGADRSGADVSARIAAQIPVKAAGHVHYLVNNLPYGQSLEDGGSKQAPSGVVGITLLETDQVVARAAVAAGV